MNSKSLYEKRALKKPRDSRVLPEVYEVRPSFFSLLELRCHLRDSCSAALERRDWGQESGRQITAYFGQELRAAGRVGSPGDTQAFRGGGARRVFSGIDITDVQQPFCCSWDSALL